MLQSLPNLHKEIQRTQNILQQSGISPTVFRPPAGITNPRLRYALQREGLVTVTFSCRAFDRGNRKITNLASRILQKIKAGDILLLHDTPPQTEAEIQQWKTELETLLSTLSGKEYAMQPLEKLIGQTVMNGIKGKAIGTKEE